MTCDLDKKISTTMKGYKYFFSSRQDAPPDVGNCSSMCTGSTRSSLRKKRYCRALTCDVTILAMHRASPLCTLTVAHAQIRLFPRSDSLHRASRLCSRHNYRPHDKQGPFLVNLRLHIPDWNARIERTDGQTDGRTET